MSKFLINVGISLFGLILFFGGINYLFKENIFLYIFMVCFGIVFMYLGDDSVEVCKRDKHDK